MESILAIAGTAVVDNSSLQWRVVAMERKLRSGRRWFSLALLAIITATAPGCVGLLATALYRGRMAPPECTALEGKKVAIVCTANSGDFGPNPSAGIIARHVGRKLNSHVKDIKVINQQNVDAWIDEHDVDYIDYAEVGKGLKADMVVAIEIESMRLQDNATLYKGNTEYTLKVIDVKNGREVFSPFTPPAVYPRNTGFHTASVSKEQFRQKYLEVVADEIARRFYEHDLNQQIAIDTPDLPE
jgi:hypothetical protein